MEKNVRLGVALGRVRFDKGMTISDISAASGVAPEVVARLEQGDCVPLTPDFFSVCQVLRTDEEALMRISTGIMPTDPVEARKKLDGYYAVDNVPKAGYGGST